MSNLKKLSFTLFLLLFESACASTSIAGDSDVMINRLLHIDSEKFMSKTDSGESFYNSLMEYKEWESLYIKYSKYDSKDKHLTKDEIKKLLFIGYITKVNSDAAISQSFSSDLVPIFSQNKSIMLNVMSDLTFLMPSTCHFLGRYFGFEGKNLEKKQAFLDRNSPLLVKVLGVTDGKVCLEYIRQEEAQTNKQR
ncbi:MAG: hypothetical protein L3J84_13470 [Gammaproteobacteria bacterium]|nr:hypothetical protein [Gammaproteobacteria bacterium]